MKDLFHSKAFGNVTMQFCFCEGKSLHSDSVKENKCFDTR